MKIIHILHPGRTGINGVTKAVFSLSKAQKQNGHNVTILLERAHSLINEEESSIVTTLNKFKQIINNIKPDIVIFHSLYYIKHLIFAYYLKRQDIPYGIVFHGGASIDNFKKNHFKKYLANKLLFNYFLKNTYGVIYLNKGEQDKSIFRKLKLKEYIIPNGIEGIVYGKDSVSNSKEIKIMFLGRMDYYGKGLDILYKAIQNIKNNGNITNIKLLLYGYAYDKTSEIWNNNGSISKYYGPVFGVDKDKAFQEANIFILPSRSEGMPITILEALANGLPCIVTPETNMADVIIANQAGWSSKLEVAALTHTIIQACNDYRNNQVTLINAAYNLAKQYSWHKIAANSIPIYNSIINNSTS